MSLRPLLLPLLLMPLTLPARAADEVIIYRCVSPKGALTLRDSPCLAGEQQQTRAMQRPRAPAPANTPAPAAAPSEPPAAAAPAPVRSTTVIYRTPPRPMYECVTDEGERYTSDTGEGQPRWVPFWTVGYPHYPHWRQGQHSPGSRPPVVPPGQPPPPPPPGPPSRPGLIAVPVGGTWVRDVCHPLPQAEVCARLSDRRYEILRRYHSAMQSERRELDLEQRGIDARIANDCGTR